MRATGTGIEARRDGRDAGVPLDERVAALTVEQVCRARRGERDLDRRVRRALAEGPGLTLPEFVVLHAVDVLSRRGPFSMTAVAARAATTKASVTRTAQRLAGRSLVVQRRSEVDTRVVHVELTPQGRELLGQGRRDLARLTAPAPAPGSSPAHAERLVPPAGHSARPSAAR